MKLLIVEDDAQMRRLIRAVVADLAEAITECADGAEVVAAYAAQQFSCDDRVLMDLHMPHVNGLDATRQLRAVFPEAHIIIVTQDDNPRSRSAVLAAGACGYVLKDNLLELRQRLTQPRQTQT
jgi:two-component system response regulator DegU